MPQVSVIISTFNRCRMLGEALRSALGQRDVDLEVVVVDNGSTDDTEQFLAIHNDPRLRVIRIELSLGSVGGRNTGIKAASGEWVAPLDDDDLWAPEKLQRQLEAAERTGRHWVYTGCVHVDGRNRILSGRPPLPPARAMEQLPVRFSLPGGMSNVIWRQGTLDGDGLLDPELPFPADWDVCLRLSRTGPPAAVRSPLVAYRQHGSNMSRHSSQYRYQMARVEKKHATLGAGTPIDWGAHFRFVATEELRAGSRLAALRSFAQAIRLGDHGSVPRALAVALPAATQRWLHRTILSDRGWLEAAELWLREYADTAPIVPLDGP
jgi:glycosyltransferase involved in cell wall biosynthesis